LHAFPHDDQVGVVYYILTGGAEMNNPLRSRSRLFKSVYVSHHIMPKPLFPSGCGFEIDVVEIGFHLGDRLRRDAINAQVTLLSGQFQPEPPPQAELVRCRKKFEHLLACISQSERRDVRIIRVGHFQLLDCLFFKRRARRAALRTMIDVQSSAFRARR
jgi:hypothetical protein